MTVSQNEIQGLFLANYIVGNRMAGGISFNISLLVSTSDRSISGRGMVSQAINPPLEIVSNLYGEYHYQCTQNDCYIMVNLMGSQPFMGIPPVGVELQNTKLNMLLNEDLNSGVANFSYKDPETGKWIELEQVPVEKIDNTDISDLSQLAERIKATKK